MNNADKQYKELLEKILTEGREKKSRAGDTIGIFGAQLRFNLQEGFPLLTTKKVHFNGVVHELLWFLSGSTNIKYLVDNNVNIWNDDAYRSFAKLMKGRSAAARHPYSVPLELSVENPTHSYQRLMNKEEFIGKIKNDDAFAKIYGDLGEGTYGSMFRAFPYHANIGEVHIKGDCGDGQVRHVSERGCVDQISKLIESLKNNPDSRRHIVSAWHPYLVEHCTLPACHTLFQLHTEELTAKERFEYGFNTLKINPYELRNAIWNDDDVNRYCDIKNITTRRLNCQLYQRSCDLPLGGPYNISSYSLLTHLIAQSVNMVAGDFVWSIGDTHIYKNQIDGIKEQLSREPKDLPSLVLDHSIKNIFDFKPEHIKIEGYDPHPAIKIPLSVG